MLMPDVNILVYAHRRDDPVHAAYKRWFDKLVAGPGCLPETGVSPWDLVVGLAGIEGGADNLDPKGEAVTISRSKRGDECLASGGDIIEGRERVAEHCGQVQAGGSAVQNNERLGEVTVEFHDRAEFWRLALGEK